MKFQRVWGCDQCKCQRVWEGGQVMGVGLRKVDDRGFKSTGGVGCMGSVEGMGGNGADGWVTEVANRHSKNQIVSSKQF